MSRIGGKFLTTHKSLWTTGETTSIVHNLNSLDVLVVVRDIDTGVVVTSPAGWGSDDVGVTVVDANTVQLVAAAAPSGSGYAVVVLQL